MALPTSDNTVNVTRLGSILSTLWGKIKTALGNKANKTDLAASYSTSSTYAVGDMVIYNNTLYKCTTAITTPESWTSSHWTTTDVDNELDRIEPLVCTINEEQSGYVCDQTILDIAAAYNAGKPIVMRYIVPGYGIQANLALGEFIDYGEEPTTHVHGYVMVFQVAGHSGVMQFIGRNISDESQIISDEWTMNEIASNNHQHGRISSDGKAIGYSTDTTRFLRADGTWDIPVPYARASIYGSSGYVKLATIQPPASANQDVQVVFNVTLIRDTFYDATAQVSIDIRTDSTGSVSNVTGAVLYQIPQNTGNHPVVEVYAHMDENDFGEVYLYAHFQNSVYGGARATVASCSSWNGEEVSPNPVTLHQGVSVESSLSDVIEITLNETRNTLYFITMNSAPAVGRSIENLVSDGYLPAYYNGYDIYVYGGMRYYGQSQGDREYIFYKCTDRLYTVNVRLVNYQYQIYFQGINPGPQNKTVYYRNTTLTAATLLRWEYMFGEATGSEEPFNNTDNYDIMSLKTNDIIQIYVTVSDMANAHFICELRITRDPVPTDTAVYGKIRAVYQATPFELLLNTDGSADANNFIIPGTYSVRNVTMVTKNWPGSTSGASDYTDIVVQRFVPNNASGSSIYATNCITQQLHWPMRNLWRSRDTSGTWSSWRTDVFVDAYNTSIGSTYKPVYVDSTGKIIECGFWFYPYYKNGGEVNFFSTGSPWVNAPLGAVTVIGALSNAVKVTYKNGTNHSVTAGRCHVYIKVSSTEWAYDM